MEEKMTLRSAASPFSSFVGLRTIGPQLVACCYLPPAEKYPGHPDYKPAPPAKLEVQVLHPISTIHTSHVYPWPKLSATLQSSEAEENAKLLKLQCWVV